MLNLKSNVYRNEWLELVFAQRNKLYGAYELRQNYSARLAKAMLFSASFFVFSITGAFLYSRFQNSALPVLNVPSIEKPDGTIVYLMPKAQPKPQAAAARPAAPAVKQHTINNARPVVVSADQVMVEMPTQRQLATLIIGTEDVSGIDVGPGTNATGNSGGEGTGGTEAGTSASNQPFISVQHMPEFPGGQEAFSKFLSKNLRYPSQAQESNVQGRVIVSFIVETDGSLSSVQVIRGIGAGCDQEAVRVIKKAPAWHPGEQNGRRVRVQYTVPIVFNLGE
ncbi:MAG: energy transducer TonB [Sphingobacteriaceae bacterium]|jgi:protein TonB|nr:energy transducer TonB [Sphingobacteriaceae bacterium]